MERIKLNVLERGETGSNDVRRLRSQGIIPGIVYGKGKKPVPVKVSIKDIHGVKGGHIAENILLDLDITGEKGESKKIVIVKEIQKDVIKGDWLHIDFNEISLKDKIKAPVHLEFVGDSKGVSEGGVIDFIMHEIDVECLPTDIPSKITVDVTELKIGDTLYVKDIKAPEKVAIISDKEKPVVSVSMPKVEEVPAAAAATAEGAEAAEPEVISKGKKETEEEAGAAAEEGKKPKEEPKKAKEEAKEKKEK